MISLNRSFNNVEAIQTAIMSLVTLAALVLLCWILAYWTWAWFSPPAESRASTATAPTRSVASANGLFGKLPQDRASTGSAIGLLGIIAASGNGSGYAIMRFAEQPARPVKEGEEIAPNIRLAEVHPGQVVLERSGIFETLALPEKKTSAESIASPLKK